MAAEKATAATAAESSSSFEGTAAVPAAGDKRGATSQTPIGTGIAKKTTRANSPADSSTATPPPTTGGDPQSQPPESVGAAPAEPIADSPTVTFDPVTAGTIPSNLLFGPFGCLGDAALKDLDSLTRTRLTDLAITLKSFPNDNSISTKLTVPALRHLISATTGTAGIARG